MSEQACEGESLLSAPDLGTSFPPMQALFAPGSRANSYYRYQDLAWST